MSTKPISAISNALKVFAHRFSTESSVTLLPNVKPNIRVTVAITEIEKKEAFHLAYIEYLKKGFIEQSKFELLVHEADLIAETIVLNAYVEKELAGTVSIVTNKGSKLPFVSTFAEKSPEFLLDGNYSEIIRLAISEKFKSNNDVLVALFNHAYICSKYIRNASGFVIEVNPRHKRFYEKMIGFVSLEVSSPCSRVKDAPAELLWIYFKNEETYREKYTFLLPVPKQLELAAECLLRIKETPVNKKFNRLIETICFDFQSVLV